jgi:peptidoglycan/LPS O-acetylase OafA/YrhL
MLGMVAFDYVSLGRIGVVAFFCISGFVIPFSFKGQRPLSNFVVSRVFRLYPAYWVACAIAFFWIPELVGRIDARAIVANATMMTKFLGQPYILGVAWTLTIEIMFYVICFGAFSVRLLHSAWFNFAAILVFGLAALAMAVWRWFHPASALPVGIATFLGVMHFGTLARLWLLERNAIAIKIAPLALGLLIVVMTAANYLGYAKTNESEMSVTAIISGYLIGLAFFLWCIMRRSFTGRVWVFLGSISYSLYLVHPILLANVSLIWPDFAAWQTAAIALTLVYIAASCLLAFGMFRLVELPAQARGHMITRRWRRA